MALHLSRKMKQDYNRRQKCIRSRLIPLMKEGYIRTLTKINLSKGQIHQHLSLWENSISILPTIVTVTQPSNHREKSLSRKQQIRLMLSKTSLKSMKKHGRGLRVEASTTFKLSKSLLSRALRMKPMKMMTTLL
jgi:hypothetical protein